MSTNLACARARKAAAEWLSHQWPNGETHFTRDALTGAFEAGYLTRINDDVLGGDELTLTVTVLDEAARGGKFTHSDLMRATRAMLAARDRLGAIEDEHTIQVAEGQRQLDAATALMIEAAEQFRRYEAHHIDKVLSLFGTVPDDPVHATAQIEATKRKIGVNALLASRLEAWLRGDDQYPISVSRDYSDGQTHVTYLPDKPGEMSPADQAAQEAFVSAALDAGIAQITEADEPPFADRTLDDCKAKFHDGGFVTTRPEHASLSVVLTPGGALFPGNAADIARQIGERMVDGETIKGVDHESFDRAAAYLDQPVEISAIMAPPLDEATLTMAVRRHWAEGAGFKYWEGGEGPPADLDEDGEVMIDWGEQTESGPRFTMCGVGELTPMPGLWAETIDPDSFGTIIGYHADPTLRPLHTERVRVKGVTVETQQEIRYEVEGEGLDLTRPILINGVAFAPTGFPTPADAVAKGQAPRNLIAAEPDPLAEVGHARNWLISAESLIAEASAFIRGVTGANPGSDSEDICKRLDAWLCPLATAPAEPTKED